MWRCAECLHDWDHSQPWPVWWLDALTFEDMTLTFVRSASSRTLLPPCCMDCWTSVSLTTKGGNCELCNQELQKIHGVEKHEVALTQLQGCGLHRMPLLVLKLKYQKHIISTLPWLDDSITMAVQTHWQTGLVICAWGPPRCICRLSPPLFWGYFDSDVLLCSVWVRSGYHGHSVSSTRVQLGSEVADDLCVRIPHLLCVIRRHPVLRDGNSVQCLWVGRRLLYNYWCCVLTGNPRRVFVKIYLVIYRLSQLRKWIW